jgi:HK97 family phage prohead protease
MPMPTPRGDEDRDEFMARCMGNETMLDDFPDQDQRAAVCLTQWRERDRAASADGGRMKTKDFRLQVKDVAEDGVFEGYASTFGGAPDSYGDIITPGAFALSLAKHRREGTMPMMFFGHQSSSELPIGDWLEMAEDGKGLWGKGRFALDDPLGARVHAAAKNGRVAGLSIGYETRKSHPDDKRPGVSYLDEIHVWEASVVNFPANRRARIEAVKSERMESFAARLRDGDPPPIKEFEDILREAGVPKSMAVTIASRGYAHAIRSESEGTTEALKAIAAFAARLGG